MTRFVKLDDMTSVAGQLWPDDIGKAAKGGFQTIICNRPDDEAQDQPSTAEIKAIAAGLGLQFHYIPVGGLTFDAGYVNRMAEAIGAARGPVLAYCRSGLRSALIWALASVQKGASPDTVIQQVETAGFPTRVIRTSLGRAGCPSAFAA